MVQLHQPSIPKKNKSEPPKSALIDAVFLWCDGSEHAFTKQKTEALKKLGVPLEEDNVGALRFADNEELKFSLRSIFSNAPWINHIYIVTNNQTPPWLRSHPKISIIDHKEVIPSNRLPTFNSVVIEMYVHLIPGLQEKFLLFNDDMFILNPVQPAFFFQENLPIVRLKKAPNHFPKDIPSAKELLSNKGAHSFELTQIRALLLAWEGFKGNQNSDSDLEGHEPLVLTHTTDAFTKTAVRKTLERFPEILVQNRSPFRTGEEIQRLIFQLYMMLSMGAPTKVIPPLTFIQKHFPRFNKQTIECFEGTECEKVRTRIRSLRPTLFCLNSDKRMDPDNRKKTKDLLQDLFPTPAPWEK